MEVISEQGNKSQKKRKIDNNDNVKSLRCEFFLEKKRRMCSMQRKAGEKYCSQHVIQEKGERIPCPLDNKHTIWAKDLERHVKKCNARPKEVRDPWFSEDLNVVLQNDSTKETKSEEDSGTETDDLFEKYIPLIKKLNFDPLEFKVNHHDGLESRLSELTNQKHALQHASLIGNLREENLLHTDTFYLEFGCGKGEFSKFVNLCVLQDVKNNKLAKKGTKYGFGFIDRGVNRMKVDNKIIKDCEEYDLNIKPIIKRTRIDIKDINLDKFLEDIQPEKVVGISKHLCGAATDLTLKSLLNSSLLSVNKLIFGGILIAMCCRHVCSFDQLLPQSKVYLSQNGFLTQESFNVLRKAVSWAVCGDGKLSNISLDERYQLGLTARRLIDESRVYALRQLLPDFKVEMFYYTQLDVTLENVCLCIKPKNE